MAGEKGLEGGSGGGKAEEVGGLCGGVAARAVAGAHREFGPDVATCVIT